MFEKMEKLYQDTKITFTVIEIRSLKKKLVQLNPYNINRRLEEHKNAIDGLRAESLYYLESIRSIFKPHIDRTDGLRHVGYIDSVIISGGRARVEGWAYDSAANQRISCVAIVYRGAILEVATVDQTRVDVAAVFRLYFNSLGFDVDMPAIDPIYAEFIQVFGLSTAGEIVLIKNSSLDAELKGIIDIAQNVFLQ